MNNYKKKKIDTIQHNMHNGRLTVNKTFCFISDVSLPVVIKIFIREQNKRFLVRRGM